MNGIFKSSLNQDFCTCNNKAAITSEDDGSGFGYWYVCTDCGKRIEDGYHYYNHADGEDNDDIDID